MVPPTAQVLREAEDWLSSVKPLRGSPNLMDGIRLALAYEDVDVVYVLTSGLPHRCDVEYTLKNLRSMNVRDLPIHVIGIDCEPTAELHLRRLASENSGSFRSKRFDSVPSMMTTLNRTRSGVTDTEDSRMTIAGQLKILEVMTEESESQECDWLEEQKCANRLLFTTASQAPVPDVETSRIMTRRAASADVHRHKGSSQRTLREMLQLGPGSPGEDIERTPTAKNGRKLPSMPRPPVQAKGLGDAPVRGQPLGPAGRHHTGVGGGADGGPPFELGVQIELGAQKLQPGPEVEPRRVRSALRSGEVSASAGDRGCWSLAPGRDLN